MQMNRALQEMENRSETSRAADPCLAPNLHDFRVIIKQGILKSNEDRNLWFIYNILSDGNQVDFSSGNPRICWSAYLKKGKKIIPIWQYHSFSQELLSFILKDME